jgi:hypothetical protein
MPETSQHVQLTVDGESVDVHKAGHDADQLRAYLESDQGFAAFKADPKRVLADRHLSISDGLAQKLKEALVPAQNLSELKLARDGGSPFSVWALAEAAYSMANTKVIAQAVSSIIGGH